MQIKVLGPVEVVDQGAPLAIKGPRVRRLLAALALHANHVVTTDRLVDMVWPDELPEDPVGSLQKHVWTLRHTFRDAGLDTEQVIVTSPDGHGYRLIVGDDEVDLLQFESLVAAGRRVLAQGRADEAAELLAQGLGLWRGPALGDLCDCDAGRAAAARLEELRLAALEDRIDIDLAAGRAADAIGELDELVEAHPYRERLWGRLILARYRTGRQADALRTFQDARRVLRDELGLEPGEELRQLERRILEQDPELTRTVGRRRPSRSSGNLPARATSFVGRSGELTDVARLLRSARLVTLAGPGGVGKTRLALEAAVAVAGDFDDGVWLVELGRVEQPDAVAHAVADTLGVHPRPGASRVDALVNALAARKTLLVLDTCEHVVDAAAELLDTVLQRCAQTTVLATSRERLRVPGEHIYDVHPLPTPDRDLGPIALASAPAPALELLIDRARASTVADEFDLVAMAEIARRLDGLPLALELAAPRLRSMTAAELLKRLERPLQDLIGGPRTADRRQQTLRATVEWSYALLNERQRAVFERMSVFVGGASFHAAEAICADDSLPVVEVATVLGDLVDRSVLLVSQRDEDGQTRYRLLDTLRDFGRERLAETGTLDELRRRHAHHFGSFVTEQRRAFAGPGEVEAYFSVDREFENIRAAHSWALESGDIDLALGLPATLRWWAQMQLRPEVFEWAERAIDAFGDDERAIIGDRLARALGTAATGVWMRGDYSASAKLCDQGLGLASSDLTRAELLTPFGMVALLQGRLDECIAVFAEATALAAEAGDAYHAAVWMTAGELALSYRGDSEQALAMVEAQGRRLAALGQPATGTAMALHLYATGEVLLERDPERALEALDRSLAICRSGICPFVMGVALVSATSLRARHGDPSGAIDAFSEAVKHWWQAGEWAQQWITLRNLIELLDRLGQHRPAAILLGACEAAVQAPPLFGPAAARLTATVQSLRSALGEDEFDKAHAHGSELTGANILQFALEALQAAKRQ